MTLTTTEIARLLLALGLLLIAAHACGELFARFGQPPVIGEILGGLLLGPTVFGALFPAIQAEVFPEHGPTAPVLAAIYQLGLFLLMFAAGAEVRSVFHRGERKTATLITLLGCVVPFAGGLVVLQFVDLSGLHGKAATDTSFLLVTAVALAVTSIPVISRIMLDLGILESPFARIVLTVAVIEDIALYVVLAIALALVRQQSGDDFGLPALLNLDPASTVSISYHVLSSVAFFAVLLWLGPNLLRRLVSSAYNALQRRSPIAFQLAFMLTLTGACLFMGITPLFGAFIAGMVVGVAGDGEDEARESIKSFAFAFFVPVYFAMVGLRLDLIHSFDPLFFLVFFAFACAIKALSVYAGARLAGQARAGATNLAVALNARGGPGIVLAAVAFDAAIINEEYYVSLVMFAVLTSMLAGSWLERVVRSGGPLLDTAPLKPTFEAAPETLGISRALERSDQTRP